VRKQDREEYLSIDHRHAGAPQPDALMVKAGYPQGAGRGLYETAVIICHCCNGRMIKNPKRTRPRGYCRKHDAYRCDECEARVHLSGICVPWSQVKEEALNAAAKGHLYVPPF
jgi:hypothetical protein